MLIHKLDWEEEYAITVIGISSQAPLYKICWGLNNTLSITFLPDEKPFKNRLHKEDIIHEKFTSHWELFKSDVSLLNNQSNSRYLLPELKHLDYILVFPDNEEMKSEIKKSLKSIHFVLGIFEIDINTLKSKNNLLF